MTEKNEFEKLLSKSEGIDSQKGAVDFIVDIMNISASPTFGFQDWDLHEGYPIDPYSPEDYDEDEEDGGGSETGDACREITSNHEKALRVAGEVATKWNIHFDPVLFESIMNKMRSNGSGLWNASSIGC